MADHRLRRPVAAAVAAGLAVGITVLASAPAAAHAAPESPAHSRTSGTLATSGTSGSPGQGPVPAVAGSIPSVDILPAHSTTHGPNKGLWFVYRAAKGASFSSQAMLINAAYVPQTVSLSARELDFSATGTPSINPSATAGVASWITFAKPTVVVPARSHRLVSFTVTVPADADPGDTTGTMIATGTAHKLGTYNVTTRTATRLYVTVPGKVITSFTLGDVTHHVSNPVWPSSGTVSVTVTNTGSVRFVPHLRVNGTAMTGSNLIVSKSAEVYTASFSTHWYGGHVHERIIANANGKDRQVLTRSFWVIPWTLGAIALVALVALVHAGRLLLRWRTKEKAMRQRLRDLEALAANDTGATMPERIDAGSVDRRAPERV